MVMMIFQFLMKHFNAMRPGIPGLAKAVPVVNRQPVDLRQERVTQFRKHDPNSIYACFFTCWFMYAQEVYGFDRTWEDYKTACVNLGAIRDDFWLLDLSGRKSKMAAAFNHPELTRYDTTVNVAAKIHALLEAGKPVPVSLNSTHYESVDGREVLVDKQNPQGRWCFRLDDPGGQGDTHADCETMEVFHLDAAGNRVHSKHKNGANRKITRAYYMV